MKHLRPTTIIACLALFLSLGGGAGAASYVITRSSQIKPSVLTQLKGRIVARNKQIEVGPLALGKMAEVEVLCPAGSSVTGGGGQVTGGKLALTATVPANMGRGWAIEAQATRTGASGSLLVFVFCQD